MDGKIRVKSGLLIEVNDVGETITIPVEDSDLIEKFYGLVESLTRMCDSIQNTNAVPQQSVTVRDALKLQKDMMRKVSEEIDGVFGAETCRKVFGDIVPSPYAIMDFLEQLIPIFEKYSVERNKKIGNRYTRRKGRFR